MANTLTAQDFAILQQFVNNQDRYGYWNYLAARGDAYAALALGVVTGANSEGFVANAYAATYAPKGSDLANANIVTKAWWGIGVGLMTADLQARQKLENPGDSSLDLSFKTILEYHKKVFADNTPSLPPQAWTPYVPFEGYINGGDWTTANQKWHQMISGGVNEYIASLTALANSGGALVTDKTAWLATTGAISTGYANLVATQGNTRIALLNANYINGWSYDKSSGQWINEQMALAGLGAGALFAVADAVTAAQLNQERQNRLARFGGHALQISGVMDASWNDGRGTLYDGAQQLAGTQNSPTQANGSIVWTDANQVQYEFSLSINPTIGTMKISGGVLASTGGPLVIDNFDLNQAETNSDGYLGIKLQEKSALSAHSSGGSGTGGSGNSGSGDSFRDGNYQPSDITATTQGVVQALTVYASAISDKAQTVILTLNNADASQFKINTGEDFRAFDGSSVKLTIPAGSDSVTVGLLYLGDPAQSQTVQLTSALTDADGAPDKASTTNTLTVTYDNSHAPGDPTYVVQGNPDKQNIWGKADDGDYIYDARDKTAQNFVSVDHGPAVVLGNNGDNLVLGNGQRGLYFAGNGNNRVYADQKVDLATALANAATATATGQQGSVIGVGDGNNTIVGGNNDDAILAGTGNNTVVLGAGNDTFLGGVEILGGSLEWSASLTPLDSDPNAKLLNLKHVLWAPAAYDEPEDYEGNRSLTGAPFGMGNDVIFGGSGSHLVELSNGDNYVDAGSGDSTIDGGMGDNTIFGGTGNVVVRAGGGDDYIDSESGNDKVAGGGGDNTIFGGSGNDTIFAGGSGDAWATSEKGNNYVEAGSGNSVLYGSGGNDTLIAGAGHDTLHAGAGNEYLQGGTGDTLMFGGSGNDTLVAGDGNDTISAGTGNTTIHGGDGADQIYGGAGKTLIYAGDGGTSSTPTQIVAGTGDTTVYGGGGIDLIFGGSGSNVLYAGDGGTAEQATGVVAGDGDTTVYGGSGIDIIVGGAGKDVLYAGAGGIEDNPTYVLGGSSDSTLVAGSGVSQLVAGGGNTTFVFNADSGKATIQGGGGCTLEFGSGIGVSDLTLSAVRAFDGSAALSIEVATGGSITVLGGLTGSIGLIRFADGSALNMNDLMAQANVMPATIETSSGLVSFGDADSSSAGSGDTIHYAARSDDTLTGGAGNDTFVIDSPDQVVVSQPNQGTDTIQASVSYTLPDNVNNLTLTGTADLTGVGNSLDNVITGNAGNNTLIAGSGNATLIGGGGADTMIGGMGNTTFVVEDASDVVIAQPDAGTSTVQSSVSFVLPEHANKLTLTGSDNLVGTGNALANAISANAGDDTLIGGGGDDTLIGGAGKDTFVFTKGDGADMVIGGTGGKNTILLSDDIASSDLSATQLGNDLLLQVSGTKASFLVQDYFTNAQTWMLMSSAGTSLSLDEIIRRSSEAGVEAKVDGYRTAFFSALQNALNLPSVPVTTVTATKHLETTTTTEKVSDPEYRFVSNDAIASYLASQHETKTSLPAGSVPVYGEGSDGDLSIIGYNVLIGQTTRWVTHTSSHEVTDYSYTTSYASASSQGAAISLVHGGSEGEGLAMSGPFNAVDAGAGDDFVSDGVSGDPSALTGDTRWEYKSLSGDPLQNKFAFGLSANFIYGGDGNDTLIGTGDNDMLIGGSDDDTLSGGAGADVYTALKGNGEGWDLIVDTGVVTVTKPPLSDDMTDSDRQLLAGLTRIGNSYALNKAAIDAYREIALNHSGYSTVDEAARDVGSIGYALYGVYGTTDILDSSVDSSRFPKANEYDKILEKFRNYGVMPTDTVQFDAGITLADLRYSFGTVDLDKQRTTLNISWGEDSGIKVVLADADDPVGYGVEFFKFSDGMVLGMSQMLALANPQPADVFTFKPGIGSTVLPSTVDKIAVDQGILPGDVAVSRDGTDLLISSHAGADAVRVSDWYREPGTQPNLTITFADGTVWDATALTAQGLAVTDTAGNKTLTGLTGFANVLTAGINDTLVGGGGNDTFIVNAGMGAIHINATGSNNTLKFGAGITADTITLGTGSLLLRVGTQGDVVHIEGFDPSNALGSGSIQRFSFADGSVLTYEQLLAKGFDLYGTDGNDTLTGTSAANRFYGGMGDDTYVVRHSNDVIIEKAGGGLDTVLSSVSYVLPANVENLTLTGTADLTATGNGLNNVITGNGGNDTLIGGTGSDTLVAGASIATMAGGKGSDTYVVNNAADVINEQESQGTDTIVASVSYVLPANVENLTLTGTDNLTATGNDLNNVITGNAGNDTLIAGSGKATLVGGSGVDTMIGGLGHNTYKVNNSNDVIVAKADALSNTVLTSVSYVLPTNVKTLTATGSDDLTLTGNDADSVITGNGGNDTLVAGSGNATLVAGAGLDTMIGGLGRNTYKLNDSEDVVIAQANALGNTIQTSANYVLPANVRILTGIGNADLVLTGNDLDDVITGNAGNDTLVAGTGNATLVAGSGIDTMIGGLANNTYKVNNAADVIIAQENAASNTVLASVSYALPANVKALTGTGSADLVLTGNDMDNVITGNTGNDTLAGGAGNDTLVAGAGLATMMGGAGDDTYKINNIADVIVEQPNEGINTILTSVSYALPSNVQNITATGSADVTLTGNDLDNVIIGNAGNNTLIAGTGNATLVGGSGIDTMIGGAGNNTFKVNDVGDVVIQKQNTGANIVQSSVSFVLPDNVQALLLTGKTSLTATGNSGNGLIVANSGNDTLIGGTGFNVLQGGAGRNMLRDENGSGVMLGAANSDTIIGGTGADFIAGGSGNDSITLGSANSVVAYNKGDGKDTIIGSSATGNTLSLGGGIAYSDLTFSKSGNNLVLGTGGTNSIVFQNWYASTPVRDFVTLQVLEQASPDYDPNSTNTLVNQKVEQFDFGQLVTQFDQARAKAPGLTSWNLMISLLNAHLAGSDSAAIGGDLAYYQGTKGGLTGMDLTAAVSAFQDSQFGRGAQTVHAWSTINQSPVTLR